MRQASYRLKPSAQPGLRVIALGLLCILGSVASYLACSILLSSCAPHVHGRTYSASQGTLCGLSALSGCVEKSPRDPRNIFVLMTMPFILVSLPAAVVRDTLWLPVDVRSEPGDLEEIDRWTRKIGECPKGPTPGVSHAEVPPEQPSGPNAAP